MIAFCRRTQILSLLHSMNRKIYVHLCQICQYIQSEKSMYVTRRILSVKAISSIGFTLSQKLNLNTNRIQKRPKHPDPVPSLDPVSSLDPVLSLDPVPSLEPVPSLDPGPSLDPVPNLDPVPSMDPVPSLDPVPILDPVPSLDLSTNLKDG